MSSIRSAFIEDQRFDRPAVEVSSLIYCSSRFGGGDHNIPGFSLKTSAWFMYATPPVMVAMSRCVCGQLTGMVGNLHRQLTGRRQDKNTRRP